MSNHIDRRRFLEVGGSVALGLGLGSTSIARAADKLTGGAPHAEKLGWRLAIQAWSFNHYSFSEAIEKTNRLNLRISRRFPIRLLIRTSQTRRSVRIARPKRTRRLRSDLPIPASSWSTSVSARCPKMQQKAARHLILPQTWASRHLSRNRNSTRWPRSINCAANTKSMWPCTIIPRDIHATGIPISCSTFARA